MKKTFLAVITTLAVLFALTATAERKIWLYSHDGTQVGMDIQELDSISTSEPIGLALSTNEKKLSCAGGVFTLGIKTTEKWQASSENPMAVKLSKTSGDGNDEITVTAVANQGQQTYTSSITVSLKNGMSKSLLVTVFGKEDEKDLEIKPLTKTLTSEGGRFTLDINTRHNWTVTVEDASKITLSAYKGEGDSIINVVASPTYEQPYSCTVTIETDAGAKKSLKVNVSNKKYLYGLSDLRGSAYSEISWLHDYWGYWGLNTLTSDEARCPVRNPGNNWDDSGYWASLNTMDWNYETNAFELEWDMLFRATGAVTTAIVQATDMKGEEDNEYYREYISEMRVLRAYFYYTLFDCFGRIPYIADEDFKYNHLTGYWEFREETPLLNTTDSWNYIVSELEENTPNLPIDTLSSKFKNYGRVTQGLGYALLARLYLNAESMGIANIASPYKKCIEYCDKVINSKAYSIADNFFDNFLVYNESSPENIFVIVENGHASFNYQDVAGKMCNKLRINLVTQHYSFQTLYNTLERPFNGFAASTQFMSLYEQSDRRGPCPPNAGTDIDFQDKNTKFGWFLGPVKDKDTGIVMKDYNGNNVVIVNSFNGGVRNASWNDGARCMKYETEIGPTFNKYMENDFVLFRYADVLYMKAEAMLRNGDDITPLLNDQEFRKIRIRAGVEPYSSLTLDEILDERGREFAWENVRRRDLIRFKKYTGNSYMWDFKAGIVAEYKKWFPIPKIYMEMHANDKIPWTQNEGY